MGNAHYYFMKTGGNIQNNVLHSKVRHYTDVTQYGYKPVTGKLT
jgi:hypothetical protein